MKPSLGATSFKKQWLCVSLLYLQLIAPAAVFGESVCLHFQPMLARLKHTRDETAPASFVLNGKRYQGCEVVFETKWFLIGNDQDPQEMFYPSQNSELYLTGWRVDDRSAANGPGSTSYLIRNVNTFCSVRWDFVAHVDNGKAVEGDKLTCHIQFGTD